MTPFLQLALSLVIIITAAKVGGYLSFRLGQPAVLGELLVGILLGPSIIDLQHLSFVSDKNLSTIIYELAQVGVLLLMFLAGINLHIKDLLHASKPSGMAGSLGVLLTLVLGTATGMLFSMQPAAAIFTSLALAATSVSIAAQTLMELKVIRSRVGTVLLGAAVFDDTLVILGLSIFTALSQPGVTVGFWEIAWILARMLLFIIGASLVGWLLFPHLTHRIHNQPISQGLIAFTFVTILLYGWLAETAGSMAAVTGAFLAGLWFGRTSLKERISTGISTIAYGIFVPIFFINIGLSADAHLLNRGNLLLFGMLTLVAIVGKVVGAGGGARLGGLQIQEALRLGVGMMSRGEVNLIVASVGVSIGLITPAVFSAVVGVIILTNIISPLLLRYLFSSKSGTAVPEQGSQEGVV
jgi:Kef-type K+ transport system membrane component KefB